MSIKGMSVCAAIGLFACACSSAPAGTTTGGGGSSAGTYSASVASSTSASVGGSGTGGASAAGGADPGTWSLQSNITVNGRSPSKDIRSAVSRTVDLGQGPQMVVELTSAVDYCALLQKGGCLANGEILVTFTFNGQKAADYPTAQQIPAEPNSVDVFMTGIDKNCTGVGLGLDQGDVKVTEASLVAGGRVALQANLSSAINGSLSGTVKAPYCVGAD